MLSLSCCHGLYWHSGLTKRLVIFAKIWLMLLLMLICCGRKILFMLQNKAKVVSLCSFCIDFLQNKGSLDPGLKYGSYYFKYLDAN